jgi:hypothetical protein
MRHGWIALALLTVVPAIAHAQQIGPEKLGIARTSLSIQAPARAAGVVRSGFEGAVVADSRSSPALALGGLLGGAVGFVGGFYAGALMADGDDGDDLDFLSGGVAGATIGEGLLLPLGVHVANGQRGSYLHSAAASLGIAAAGLLALEALHYDPPGAPIVLVAVPVAQLAASIAIERATD